MYFGYQSIWMFTFVPIAFVLVMAVGIGLAFVYAVGASRGRAAALAYTRFWFYTAVGGTVLILGYAYFTGQWSRFIEVYGWVPVLEMVTLAVMFVGAMLLMAVSYVRSKTD